MKLFYYSFPDQEGRKGNFGDELNPWLFGRLLSGVLDDDPRVVFVGIGTILNTVVLPPAQKTVVFGSGAGYGDPPTVDPSWNVYCVRGPLTARILGLSEGAAVTDPAMLVRDFIPPVARKSYRVSFMPHINRLTTAPAGWRDVCHDAGVHFIDPTEPVDDVLEQLSKSELL